MMDRTRTLSLRLSDEEVLKAHALADANDESVGRFMRALLNQAYAKMFGLRPPPKVKTRMGRPRKAKAGAA